MVRHLVAASTAVVILLSGCSDDGSGSADGPSDTAADDAAGADTVPRLTTDLEQLAAQLERGEIEIPPDYEPPPRRQVDQTCLSSVLNHLVRAGAIEEGDLMLWYSGVEGRETGSINRAIYTLLSAGDCLTT